VRYVVWTGCWASCRPTINLLTVARFLAAPSHPALRAELEHYARQLGLELTV
jgi:hypothetical protein